MHEELLVGIAAAANKDMITLETAKSSAWREKMAVQDRTMLSAGMVLTYYIRCAVW